MPPERARDRCGTEWTARRFPAARSAGADARKAGPELLPGGRWAGASGGEDSRGLEGAEGAANRTFIPHRAFCRSSPACRNSDCAYHRGWLSEFATATAVRTMTRSCWAAPSYLKEGRTSSLGWWYRFSVYSFFICSP